MDTTIRLLLFLAFSFTHLLSATAQALNPISRITVVGVVFCDICSTNTFSRHSYFLPGVEVNIECKFKAKSPKTTEQMTVSVNRTTNKYGVYKVEIPHVDGVDCVEGLAMESVCKASLIEMNSKSRSGAILSCNVPGLKSSTNQISVKSKQDNLCIFSLNALSYRPSRSKRNATLCRNHKEILPLDLNSSKCIFPFPNFGFPWPFPSLPFPPLSSLPFPPLPPLPSWPFPFMPPSPPPAFKLGDPTTWIPKLSPPPPPPPPPAFNLRDPKTWIPYIPPSPPSFPQNPTP